MMIFTTCLLAIASVFIVRLSDAISPIAELHLYEQRNKRLSEQLIRENCTVWKQSEALKSRITLSTEVKLEIEKIVYEELTSQLVSCCRVPTECRTASLSTGARTTLIVALCHLMGAKTVTLVTWSGLADLGFALGVQRGHICLITVSLQQRRKVAVVHKMLYGATVPCQHRLVSL